LIGLTAAYLKQLDSNNSKHELKKAGDQDNVANSLYCDYHALDYVLWGQIHHQQIPGTVCLGYTLLSPALD
jgi:uncharacterized iron-regulated protein